MKFPNPVYPGAVLPDAFEKEHAENKENCDRLVKLKYSQAVLYQIENFNRARQS